MGLPSTLKIRKHFYSRHHKLVDSTQMTNDLRLFQILSPSPDQSPTRLDDGHTQMYCNRQELPTLPDHPSSLQIIREFVLFMCVCDILCYIDWLLLVCFCASLVYILSSAIVFITLSGNGNLVEKFKFPESAYLSEIVIGVPVDGYTDRRLYYFTNSQVKGY